MTQRRLTERIGRRGAVLINFGIVWILIGLSEVFVARQPEFDDLPLISWVPDPLRLSAWVVCGVVAILAAFRPPVKWDGWGFLALYVMPAFRALGYLWGWCLSWDHEGGYPSGWLGAALYLAITVLIVICSGWREEQPDPEEEPS